MEMIKYYITSAPAAPFRVGAPNGAAGAENIEYFIISMILQRAHLPEGPAAWVRNIDMWWRVADVW